MDYTEFSKLADRVVDLWKGRTLPPEGVPHQNIQDDHKRAMARAFVVAEKAGRSRSYQPHHDTAVGNVVRTHEAASRARARVVSSIRSGNASRSPQRHAHLVKTAQTATDAAHQAEQHPHYHEARRLAGTE